MMTNPRFFTLKIIGRVSAYSRLLKKDERTGQKLEFLLSLGEMDEINMIYGQQTVQKINKKVLIADPTYWELLSDERYLIPWNFCCEW